MDARTRPRDDGVEDRGRVLALLREHGWNSTSFQVLEPGFRYWFDRDACIMAVAVLAPAFAATLLWSGRAHRRARGDS